MDFDNFTDPNDKNERLENEDSFESDGDSSLLTMHDMLEQVIKLLKVKGYRLHQNPTGQWAGFDVYVLQNIMLDGIECDARIYKLMPSHYNGTFLTAIRLIVENAISDLDPKEQKGLITKWVSIYNSFETPKNVNTVVYQVSHTFANDKWMRQVSLKAVDNAWKVAPNLDMLPKRVRELDAEDLLHMLPPAERTMIMLALGRACIGADGQQIFATAKTYNHKWRGFFFIQSDEAGVGKSTFMDLLAKVLTELGYVVSDLPPRISSSFGWHDAAVADIIIVDDINEPNQKALMSNEQMKKISSNGRLTTEEKGIKHLPPFKSTSILIGATNTIKQEHYLGLDKGSTSRANICAMYPSHTLPEGDNTLIDRWNALATKYDCTWECLMIALLSKCKDMFLEGIKDSVKLAKTYENLRENYLHKPGVTAVEDVVRAAEELTALVIADMSKSQITEALKHLEVSGFSGEHLLSVLHATLSGYKIGCSAISRNSVKGFNARYSDLVAKLDNGSRNIFEEVSTSVYTSEGWHLPKRPTAYTKYWSVGNVKMHLRKYQEMLEQDRDAFKDLHAQYDLTPIQSLFRHMSMGKSVDRPFK